MNTAQAIAQSRNKMRSLQLLSAHGIDIPATVMARDAADLKEMVGLVGGVPVLVKLLQGQEKHGVMVCESLQSLEAALEAVLGLGHNLVVQQYVQKLGAGHPGAGGGRAGGGGGGAPAEARPALAHAEQGRAAGGHRAVRRPARVTAEQAARLVGLEVAAVDLLDVKGQPKVFEVNSSPALPEMEAATGMDLATPIIERAEALLAGAPGSRCRNSAESRPDGVPLRGRRRGLVGRRRGGRPGRTLRSADEEKGSPSVGRVAIRCARLPGERPMLRRLAPIAALWLALVWTQARAADEVDPTTLYEVSTEGTSTQVKAGEKGVFVLVDQEQAGLARLGRGAAEAPGEGHAADAGQGEAGP